MSILVLVLLGVSTLASIKFQQNKNDISDGPWGGKASINGIIDVWNIDTFSGGSISKCDYLNSVARKFESANKGLYINIVNMKAEEFELATKANKKPVLISFGYGIGESAFNMLKPIEVKDYKIKEEVLNSGKVNDEVFAVGYLMGAYCYFSTTEKLESASKNNNISLASDYRGCAYDKQLRKKVKHIYGLGFGKNTFLNPEQCIDSCEEVYESVDDYNAYVDFISLNKFTILLGTHRDFVKLQGKYERGDISDLIVEPVQSFNNLIQYIGITNGQDENRELYAKRFVDFLICESSQKMLESSGMFSTLLPNIYQDEMLSKVENAVWSIKNIPRVF